MRKNPCLAVIAPSDELSETSLKIIQRGITRLEELGFSIVKGSSLTTRFGDPQTRAEEINSFMVDDQIDALLFAWGGERVNETLEFIENRQKIILGHSDATVLMNALYALNGNVSYYWHFAASLDPSWEWFSEYDLAAMEQILFEEQKEIPASGPRRMYRPGMAQGVLLGGCITDLVKLIGTPYLPDFTDAILMLESYKISSEELVACLEQLQEAGVLQNISGVILGKFFIQTEDFASLIMPYFPEVPVMKTEDFGHNSHMAPFPIGKKVRINDSNITIL